MLNVYINKYFKMQLVSEFPSRIQALSLKEGNNFVWFTAIDSAPRIVLIKHLLKQKMKNRKYKLIMFHYSGKF